MKSKCIAGIVTCNPEIDRLKAVVASAICQVAEVIIVDNNSTNINEIRSLQDCYGNLLVVENKENQGIARALNQIFEVAVERNYEWVLTLDHDTICDIKMVDTLFDGVIDDSIGIVCPSVLYEGVDFKMKGYGKTGLEDVYACMTSGSLTRVAAWQKVGGFNDEYFIDFVDNEFCMKLKINNYRILRNHACEMKHSLGEPLTIKTLFGEVSVVTHKPWRFYYMVRNNLVFICQYRKYLRILREYAKLAKIISGGLRYSIDRKQTWKYIKLGYIDAKRGVLGKMKEQ